MSNQIDDQKEYTQHYLRELRGPNSENARFSLIELGACAIPYLLDAFNYEANPGICGTLVEIIWQYRLPETVPFLSELLYNPHLNIFKEAINGLVTISSPEAITALNKALNAPSYPEERREWVKEALEQIKITSKMDESGY